jgi:hypothetical protein
MSPIDVAIFIVFASLGIVVGTWYRMERARRRAAVPPRSVRMIVEIDGRTFIDIDSKLALAMLDCEYGAPIVNDYAVHGVQLRLTLKEGGTPA